MDVLKSYTQCGKHLHDCLISLRGEVLALKLFQPGIINEMTVGSQESDQSCICVLGVWIWPLFLQFSDWNWNCSDNMVFFILHYYLIYLKKNYNIIVWQAVLLMDRTEVPKENNKLSLSHLQTSFHKTASSTPCHVCKSNTNNRADRH